jgi:hypothetical protein
MKSVFPKDVVPHLPMPCKVTEEPSISSSKKNLRRWRFPKIPTCVIKIFRVLSLVGVGGLFFYAGAIKLPEPESLACDIRNYRLPFGDFAEILAALIPPVEIIAALSLAWRKTRSAGLLILGTLTVIFLMALLQAPLRGFTVNCG